MEQSCGNPVGSHSCVCFKKPLDILHESATDLSSIHCGHQSKRSECIHHFNELHENVE